MLKGKTLQPRIVYLERLSLRIGKRKNFSHKQKLKELNNTKPTLKRNVEGSPLNGKGVRVYRKGKIPIGKGNI